MQRPGNTNMHEGVVERQCCERPSRILIRLDSCYCQRVESGTQRLKEPDEYAIVLL